MKQKTEIKAIRLYPRDYELLRDIRATLEQRNPGLQVSMADAMALAVGSASAALAGGQMPAAITVPLTIRSDDKAA